MRCGTLDGLKLALNVGAMSIAFLGLLALVNGLLGWMGEQLGLSGLSLEWILSYLMFPFAWPNCRVIGDRSPILCNNSTFAGYSQLPIVTS